MTATVLLINRKPPPKIVTPIYNADGQLTSATTSLQLDAAIDENHSIKNTITQFPVEDGLNISDHIKQEPDRLKITGFVTNSPIIYGALDSGNNLQLQGQTVIINNNPVLATDKVQASYDILMKLTGRKNTKLFTDTPSFSAPAVVDVFTTLRCWLNMVVESIEIPRSKDTGDALQFVMTLVSIRKVQTAYANVNYTSSRYGAGGAGDQETAKVDTGDKAVEQPPPRVKSAIKLISIHDPTAGSAVKSVLTFGAIK